MITWYDIGDQLRLTTTFTGLDGVATDPTTVTCRVVFPNGSAATYTYASPATSIIWVSTGVYAIDLTLDESGEYKYRWYGTGLRAADQGRINVRKSLA